MKNTDGISLIEILVVITIIVLFMSIGVTRFQVLNTESGFRKDVTYFVENIGRARALIDATNSARCNTGDKLNSIEIVRTNTSGYVMQSYCENMVDPVESISYSLLNSAFDPNSDGTFVTLYTDGSIEPSADGFTFVRGNMTCNITLSAAGVVQSSGTDCP